MLLAVGIQACAGVGNATGVVTAEEDTREIPIALDSQKLIFLFFPTGKSLRLPSDWGRGEGGCCSSSVSFLITVVNMSYV